MDDEPPKSAVNSRRQRSLPSADLIPLLSLIFVVVVAIISYGISVDRRLTTIEVILTGFKVQIKLVEAGKRTILPVAKKDPRNNGTGVEIDFILTDTPQNIHASWGKGQDFQDITATLISLCDDEYPCNVSVNVDDFGPDPFPGTPKELVIEYRCGEESKSEIYIVKSSTEIFVSCL